MKHYAMKKHGGNGSMAPPFLSSALVGGKSSSSRSSALSQESSHWYASDRRASGPRSQSECYGEEKNVLPLLEIKP
jgi:hypothetical protein